MAESDITAIMGVDVHKGPVPVEDCQSHFNRLELFSLSSFTLTWFLTSMLSIIILNLHKIFCDLFQCYSLFSSCVYFIFATINPDKTLIWSLKSDSSVTGSVSAVFLEAFFSFLSFFAFIFFSCSLSSFAHFFPSFHFFRLFHVTFPCTCTTWAEKSRAVNSWDILGGKNIVIFNSLELCKRKCNLCFLKTL